MEPVCLVNLIAAVGRCQLMDPTARNGNLGNPPLMNPDQHVERLQTAQDPQPGCPRVRTLPDPAQPASPNEPSAETAADDVPALEYGDVLELLREVSGMELSSLTAPGIHAWTQRLEDERAVAGRLQAENARMQSLIAELTARMEEQAVQVEELRRLVSQREATIAAIYRSRLWRAMNPVRRVVTAVRTGRRKRFPGFDLSPQRASGTLRRAVWAIKTLWLPELYRRATGRDFVRSKVSRAPYPHVAVDETQVSLEALGPQLDLAVTVIVPTKNAGPSFPEALRRIRSLGGVRGVDLLVIDSGSDDGTVATARHMGAEVIEIPPAEFHHAHTRNLAAQRAAGDVLIFTVQDAEPVGQDWLYRLVRPIEEGAADAVSIRQLPRTGADLFALWAAWGYFRHLGFSSDTVRRGADDPETEHMSPVDLRRGIHLDNVCMAIRREVFARFRFQGAYAEDLDLGKRLLAGGYRLLFQVDNAVIHSHTRPAGYFFCREHINTQALRKLHGSRSEESLPASVVMPTLAWAYDLYCAQVVLWRDSGTTATESPAASLRAFADVLGAAFSGSVESMVPGERDASLWGVFAGYAGAAPEEGVLDMLRNALCGYLASFAEYLETFPVWPGARNEVAVALHKFFAISAGTVTAETGVSLDPQLLRGV